MQYQQYDLQEDVEVEMCPNDHQSDPEDLCQLHLRDAPKHIYKYKMFIMRRIKEIQIHFCAFPKCVAPLG